MQEVLETLLEFSTLKPDLDFPYFSSTVENRYNSRPQSMLYFSNWLRAKILNLL